MMLTSVAAGKCSGTEGRSGHRHAVWKGWLEPQNNSASVQATFQQHSETPSRLTHGKISLQRYSMFGPVSQVGSSKAESGLRSVEASLALSSSQRHLFGEDGRST